MAEQTDVCIVGGGPAGLAAAIELRRLGVARVLVVDREREAGGIPRHADHIGFGARDLHRLLTGPQYARRYVRLAARAGAVVRTGTTVIDWAGPTTLRLVSRGGIETVDARAVVLTTGCRERPRAARLVPGDRPLGVFTTGTLQQLVHLHHQPVGRRAVIVGAEHVSFSAVLTLAHAGATTVAMVTPHPRHQTYAPYRWLSATRYGVPVLTNHDIAQIIGTRRVEAVELTDLHSGATRRVDCDTVVFTGDWIPDHELARVGGLTMDPASGAPRVDAGLRTSRRGVFAAGNLVHAAETADIAALGGRHAARAVHAFLQSRSWPDTAAVPIVCEPPVQWVSPSAIHAAHERPPGDRFTWRVTEFRAAAELCIRQGRHDLWRWRYRRLVPTLPIRTPARWVRDVEPEGEPIRFGLVE
jgi:thioredoxin reductase